ncbi:MAG TPA: hypothetical protein VEI97_06940 [bacterium]|nr:hypothetical protein [bacterium]
MMQGYMVSTLNSVDLTALLYIPIVLIVLVIGLGLIDHRPRNPRP